MSGAHVLFLPEQDSATLERLGYVRRLARSLAGRATEQDWMLVCDTRAETLAPLFGRFAVDPTNTLLSVAGLGLGPVYKRWSEAEWLTLPLDVALGEGVPARDGAVPIRRATSP